MNKPWNQYRILKSKLHIIQASLSVFCTYLKAFSATKHSPTHNSHMLLRQMSQALLKFAVFTSYKCLYLKRWI